MEDVYFYYIMYLFCVGVLYISEQDAWVFTVNCSLKVELAIKDLCDLRRLRASDGLLLL